MLKYVFMKTHDGDDVECAACGFNAPLREFETGILQRKGKRFFCELCASSGISKAETYPDQFSDGYAMRAIGYVGNAILAKLGQFEGVEELVLPPESDDES